MPEPDKEKKVHADAYFPTYHVKKNAAQLERGQERPDDDEEEDEDSIEEEEDPMDGFLEPEDEMAVDCGAPYPKPIPVLSRERTMMKKERGKEKAIKVKGKFIMDGPWWIASFESVKEGDTYVCQGSPTYTLRNEKGEKAGKDLLLLLLGYVFNSPLRGSAEDQMRQAFWDYFEQHRNIRKPKPKQYTFNQFFKALEAALKEKPASNATSIPVMQAAMMIMHRFNPFYGRSTGLSRQDEDDERKKKREFDLRFVYRCYKFPWLFKVLPLLFEREALSILSTADMRNLETLDSVLRNSPEDLGFYTSMREHNWGTIEASFQGFVKAGLIPANLLKCTAKKKGSAGRPSASKSKTNKDQPSASNQPSTSTTKPGKVAPRASKSKGIKILSVKMATVLKLYDIVKQVCNRGKHTYLWEEGQVKKEWRRAAIKDYPCGKAREEYYQELKNREVVEKEKELGEPVKVHWMKYRRYEKSIASSIERLFWKHEENPWTLPLEDFAEYNFDLYQHGAANAICLQPVTIILGRGGCGKTHVVSSVIKEYLAYQAEEKQAYLAEQRFLQEVENRKENQDGECSKDAEDKKNNEKNNEKKDEKNNEKKNEKKDKEEDEDKPVVLLTAPTGRAASILKRRIGMKAKTLHSVLGTARRCDPENFPYSEVEILVVDECSMVPISVLSEVLRTLLNHSLKKVIFLGDPYQLPSIDPGNFFQDIIQVFEDTHIDSIQTLKINHRTDEGGKLINENSRLIAEEGRSDLAYQRDRFELIDTSNIVNGTGREEVIDRLIRSRWQLQNHKNSQLVAFRNADVQDINTICSHYYAGHAPFKRGGKHNHHIGDKISSRKNSIIGIHRRITPPGNAVEAAGGSREEEAGPSNKETKREAVERAHISNGDTFFIENWREYVENDGKKRDVVTLHSMDDEEGHFFEVDFKEMRRTSKLEYAWARTINTYQGSETDYIVYVISPHSRYENWQHLYTAITRGRKGCFIVGTLGRLREVVNTQPATRQTSLARFLKENFWLLQDSKPIHPGQSAPGTPGSSTSSRTNLPGQSAIGTPGSSTNTRTYHPGQSAPGTPSSSTNSRTYHPGQSATGTPGSSTNSRIYCPGLSATGTPGSSTNARTYHPGQSAPGAPSSSTNSRTYHPGQSAHGTPGSSTNSRTYRPGQSAPGTQRSSTNSRTYLTGQSATGTPGSSVSTNSRTNRPGQSAPWTPGRAVQTNVSSSNKAMACSPCKMAPRQEQCVRNSLNQATQLHSLYQDNPLVRRELDYKSTMSKSSAVGFPGCESIAADAPAAKPNKGRLSRKRKAQSNKVPVNQDQGADALVQKTAQSPKVPRQQSSENALVQETAQSLKVPKQQLSENALVQKTTQSPSLGCESIAVDAPAAIPNRSSLSRKKRKAQSDNVPVNQDQGADALVQKTAQSPKVPKQQLTGVALVQKTTQGPEVPRWQSSENAPIPKEQLPGYSQENETPIYVPGLCPGRYIHLFRLSSQESQPSHHSSRSNADEENCHFPDSYNEEPSQLLLQPPSVPLVLSLLKSSEESQQDGNDADMSSSDESGFSSSGASPCVRTDDNPSEVEDEDDDDDTDYNDVFGDDDEDGESSQSIFQPYNVI